MRRQGLIERERWIELHTAGRRGTGHANWLFVNAVFYPVRVGVA